MKRDEAVAVFSACAGELREQCGITGVSHLGCVARDDANYASDMVV
jgi:predicted nucleotidyltransferase